MKWPLPWLGFGLSLGMPLTAGRQHRRLLGRSTLGERLQTEAGVGTANSQPAAGGGTGLACVMWRRTLKDTPSGPRDPLGDKACTAEIHLGEEGFCECQGYVHTAAVGKVHNTFTCADECAKLQKIHREVFGAGSTATAGGAPSVVEGSVNSNASTGIGGLSPEARARAFGEKAKSDVATAVQSATDALQSARSIMGKMMDMQPWDEMRQAGWRAEQAGLRVQELARLARPVIYEQVGVTAASPTAAASL